jgi:hypothetical protein
VFISNIKLISASSYFIAGTLLRQLNQLLLSSADWPLNTLAHLWFDAADFKLSLHICCVLFYRQLLICWRLVLSSALSICLCVTHLGRESNWSSVASFFMWHHLLPDPLLRLMNRTMWLVASYHDAHVMGRRRIRSNYKDVTKTVALEMLGVCSLL